VNDYEDHVDLDRVWIGVATQVWHRTPGRVERAAARLLRSPGLFRGDVVDWIQLPHWPVFNVADSAIVCGGVLAVLLAARGIRLDGTRDGNGVSGGPGAPPARPVADGQAHERGSAAGGQAREQGSAPQGRAQERGSAAGDSRA